MNTEKPTILMFPSWWPTEENPITINGIFFKEQVKMRGIIKKILGETIVNKLKAKRQIKQ